MCSLRNRCARQLRTAKRLLQCYSLFLFLYWNQVELSRPFRFWFFGQIPCLWFFFFFYIYSTMNHPPLWIQEEAFIIVIHQMNDVNYVAIEDSCVFVKNLFVLNPQNAKTHDVNKNMITCKWEKDYFYYCYSMHVDVYSFPLWNIWSILLCFGNRLLKLPGRDRIYWFKSD